MPPPGYNQLRGLGPNYCIETIHPKPNVNEAINRTEKSIRLKHWIDKYGANNKDKSCIPSLYIPTKWKPPEASPDVEEAMENFSLNIRQAVEN
jgi:hypothetical protein